MQPVAWLCSGRGFAGRLLIVCRGNADSQIGQLVIARKQSLTCGMLLCLQNIPSEVGLPELYEVFRGDSKTIYYLVDGRWLRNACKGP